MFDPTTLPNDDQRRQTLPPFLADFALLPTSFNQMTIDNYTARESRQIHGASGARILPAPFHAPRLELIGIDHQLAAHLGLNLPTVLTPAHRQHLAEVFSGRVLLPGSITFSHAYAGHQFGNWAGQLGDGRATSIGDRLSPMDAAHYELSLKGAGRTAFSRNGDGRAVLRNLVREFLSGVYLHAVGVPTSGALALVGSTVQSDGITRDEFYTGQPEQVRPGVLVRVTPSFVRFGSFQLAAKRQGFAGVLRLTKQVLATIGEQERAGDRSYSNHFANSPFFLRAVDPDLQSNCFFAPRSKLQSNCAAAAAILTDSESLACFMDRVVFRTAALVAAWQSVGFAHGVMNTDNMAASGVTIDMNVFGLISDFQNQAQDYTPNFIDEQKRYAFGNQATMAHWNLQRLGDVLKGRTRFVGGDRDRETNVDSSDSSDPWLTYNQVRDQVDAFHDRYQQCYQARLKWRSGLVGSSDEAAEALAQWVEWMDTAHADYHAASRALSALQEEDGEDEATVDGVLQASGAAVSSRAALKRVLVVVRAAVKKTVAVEGMSWASWQQHINTVVPYYVMRNAALREIGAIVQDGDSKALDYALGLLTAPFERRGGKGGESSVEGENALYRHVERWLSSLPSKEEKKMTTSCGGQ